MYNQEIVKRVANADLKAFRKMYVDCAPAVYDCAYDVLHDVVRANMVVTRTFVDIFNFLPQLKKLRLFDEWVYRLTVYHADNIALEDFIRGSEKLETIWREIMDELGSMEHNKTDLAAKARGSQDEHAEGTGALYSRLREIEEEAEAIHREHQGEPPLAFADTEDADPPQTPPSRYEAPAYEAKTMEEEWTPILFPSDEAEDEPDRRSLGSLRAIRKTVLVPASKTFSVARNGANGTAADSAAYAQAEQAPYATRVLTQGEPAKELSAEQNNAQANYGTYAQEPKRAFSNESAAAVRVNPTNNDQFERFRAFLDETRTAEKATMPPPAETPMQVGLAGYQRNQDAEEEVSEEESISRILRQQEQPKPKRKHKVVRVILLSLLAFVVVVVTPLVLMAYRIFATPAFLSGAVTVTVTVLQGAASLINQVGVYVSGLS